MLGKRINLLLDWMWLDTAIHVVGGGVEEEGGGSDEIDDAGGEERAGETEAVGADAAKEGAEGSGEHGARGDGTKDATAQICRDAFVLDSVEQGIHGTRGETREELDEDDEFERGIEGKDKIAEGEEDKESDKENATREAYTDGTKNQRAEDGTAAAGGNAQTQSKSILEYLLHVDGLQDAGVEEVCDHDGEDNGQHEFVLPNKMNTLEKFGAPIAARFFLYGGLRFVNEQADDGGGGEKGGGVNPEDGGRTKASNQCAREGRADETRTAFDNLVHGTGALERDARAGGEFGDDGFAGGGAGGIEKVGEKDEDKEDVEIETDG